MALGTPGRPHEKLGVFAMMLALAIAAAIGAALGLVWHSSDLGKSHAKPAASATSQPGDNPSAEEADRKPTKSGAATKASAKRS